MFIQKSKPEPMEDHSELAFIRESEESINRRRKMEDEITRSARSEAIFVPTDIDEVKLLLREHGKPITYFGERPEERRDRLRKILFESKRDLVAEREEKLKISKRQDREVEKKDEVFYTKGNPNLRYRRRFLLNYSFRMSKERIEKQSKTKTRLSQFPNEKMFKDFMSNEITKKRTLSTKLESVELVSSNIGDRRPSQAISISPSQDRIITGSWTGNIKVWSIEKMEDCKREILYRAHKDRVTGVCVNPMHDENTPFAFASTSADRSIKLWSYESKKKPLCQFTDLSFHRYGKVSVHPSGTMVGAASYDCVFMLIDVEKQVCLCEQEGHAGEVYDVQFHPDGSLVGSCDFRGVVRIWDLRSGSTVCPLVGHCRKVMCLDFSPNGYHIASGGDDNIINIWNLRKTTNNHNTVPERYIPAHNKLISGVKFEKGLGRYFVSSSYDKTLRIWRNFEYRIIKTLKGHEGLVLGLDMKIIDGNPLIVSTSFDKTWKIWKIQQDVDL